MPRATRSVHEQRQARNRPVPPAVRELREDRLVWLADTLRDVVMKAVEQALALRDREDADGLMGVHDRIQRAVTDYALARDRREAGFTPGLSVDGT